MASKIVLRALLSASLAVLLDPATLHAQAAGPEVSAAVAHAVSPPVRDLPTAAVTRPFHEVPLGRPFPDINYPDVPDGALQGSAGPLVSTTPGLGFAGVGNGDYGFAPNAAPPDTNLAVGATQVVQWVNESFAVFNKSTGALVSGPTAGNTLFTNLGGGCAT